MTAMESYRQRPPRIFGKILCACALPKMTLWCCSWWVKCKFFMPFARDDSRWNEEAFLLHPRLSGSKYSHLKSELRCLFWSLTFNTTLPIFPIPTSLTTLYHQPIIHISYQDVAFLVMIPPLLQQQYPGQRSIWNQYNIWWIRVETTTITTCSTRKFLLLVFITPPVLQYCFYYIWQYHHDCQNDVFDWKYHHYH